MDDKIIFHHFVVHYFVFQNEAPTSPSKIRGFFLEQADMVLEKL